MIKSLKSLKYFLKSKISRSQVIGYPKSGNTWLRMLIYNYILINNNTPFNESFFDETNLSFRNYQNIIFSHGTKDRRINKMTNKNIDPFIGKNKKTIFLIRDPRDVLVSSYYHELYRYGPEFYSQNVWKKIFLLNENDETPSFSGFIRGDIRGINYIVEFMNYWYENRGKFKDFKIISYEDLHNTKETLKNILTFLSIPINEKSIDQTIHNSTFKKMREKEVNNGISQIDMSTPKDLKDIRTYKVRKGIIGNYKTELFNVEDLKYVNEIINDKLNKNLGYR